MTNIHDFQSGSILALNAKHLIQLKTDLPALFYISVIEFLI